MRTLWVWPLSAHLLPGSFAPSLLPFNGTSEYPHNGHS
jgi:hypothetical protein